MQESIKASRDWFLACAPHAGGMAVRMAQALYAQPAYDRQLHILYMANDILLKRCAQRSSAGLVRRWGELIGLRQCLPLAGGCSEH